MSIIVVNNDSWYIKEVRDSLITSGNSVVSLSDEEFIGTFQPIIKEFSAIPVEDRRSLTILVDVESIDAAECILKVLRRNGNLTSYIRVVLVSSLLTWCGKTYAASRIVDYDAEFLKRIPIASANDSYLLENSLYGFSKQSKISLSIIGVGLVYGGSGYDFKSIFNNIWTNEKSCKLLTAHTKSFVPFIHNESLIKLIVSTVEKSTPSNQIFVPAVENCDLSIQQLLTSINSIINPSPVVAASSTTTGSGRPASASPGATAATSTPAVKSPRSPRTAAATPIPTTSNATMIGEDGLTAAAAAPEEYVKCEELGVRVQKLLYDTRSSLWGADISFQVSDSSDNMLDNLTTVWKEFTESSNLKALSVIVAGNPRIGKTSAAKQIAAELQIEYVDVLESVKFAFSFTSGSIQALNAAEWNVGVLSTIRSEIDAVIEAKLNEGTKKGKDKNAPTEPQIFELSHVTEAVCSALPVELIKKCVALKLLLDTKSIRYGYVLDVWGLPNDIFGGHAALTNILSILKAPLSDEESQKTYLESLVADNTELLVELQCPSDQVLVDRLLASQGANAKAKESVAAIKTLEGILSAYRANLIPCEGADGYTTHKGVDELEKLCVGKLEVLRLHAHDISTEIIASKVVDKMFDKHKGQIGWLPTRPYEVPVVFPVVVPVEDVTNTAEETPVEATVVEKIVPAPSDNAPTDTSNVFEGMTKEKLDQIAKKSEKSQSFLSNTLLPHITAAMVIIRRERPADPIQFLADYLLEQSQLLENDARDKAKDQFYEMLSKTTFAAAAPPAV